VSKLEEELSAAEAGFLEAESAAAAARKAEIDALAAGETSGSAERRKRMAAADAALLAARDRVDLLREAALVAEATARQKRFKEEVVTFTVAYRRAEEEWTKREEETKAAIATLALSVSRLRAAWRALSTANAMLAARIGDEAPGLGRAWEPVSSPNQLTLASESLAPGLHDLLGSHVTMNRPVEVRLPVFDYEPAPSAKGKE